MAEIDREKYMSIGINVVGGASKSRAGTPRWRLKNGSEYKGATRREVEDRARELASTPGISLAEVQMGVRELCLNDVDSSRKIENLDAGMRAGYEEYMRDAPDMTDKAEEAGTNG